MVQETIMNYPVSKLGIKQKLFLNLIYYKKYFAINILLNCGAF